MNIDLTQIILAIVTLIGGILTTFVIPLLRDKLSERQMETLRAVIRTGVFAAEQLFASGEGAKKKAYVLDLLAMQGYDVDTKAIDAQIEATVKELAIELGK